MDIEVLAFLIIGGITVYNILLIYKYLKGYGLTLFHFWPIWGKLFIEPKEADTRYRMHLLIRIILNFVLMITMFVAYRLISDSRGIYY